MQVSFSPLLKSWDLGGWYGAKEDMLNGPSVGEIIWGSWRCCLWVSGFRVMARAEQSGYSGTLALLCFLYQTNVLLSCQKWAWLPQNTGISSGRKEVADRYSHELIVDMTHILQVLYKNIPVLHTQEFTWTELTNKWYQSELSLATISYAFPLLMEKREEAWERS